MRVLQLFADYKFIISVSQELSFPKGRSSFVVLVF